jgi:hypothetical protein
LVKKRFNAIYNIIPKSLEWLAVNYVINVTGGVLHGFYIFRNERLKDVTLNFANQCEKIIWMITT